MCIAKNRTYCLSLRRPLRVLLLGGILLSCVCYAAAVEHAHLLSGDLEITIFVDVTDTLCLEESMLPDTPFSLEVACDEGTADYLIPKVIDASCLTLLGLQEGMIEICLIQCTETGICDTTYLLVTILPLEAVLPVLLPDTIYIDQFSASGIQVLANDQLNGPLDTLYLGASPFQGIAQIDAQGQLAYYANLQDCTDGIIDSLQYVACNPYACSRGWVYIHLTCDDLVVYNGFSPNDDGINDVFVIEGIEKIPDHQLQIFNRWGALVFESRSYANDWDGRWAGAQLPDGSYFYLLEYGEGAVRSGFIQIQR